MISSFILHHGKSAFSDSLRDVNMNSPGGRRPEEEEEVEEEESKALAADQMTNDPDQREGGAKRFRFNSRWIHITYSGVISQVRKIMPHESMANVVRFASDNFGTAEKLAEIAVAEVEDNTGVDCIFMCVVKQDHKASAIAGDYHFHLIAYLIKRWHTTNSNFAKLRGILNPHISQYSNQVNSIHAIFFIYFLTI